MSRTEYEKLRRWLGIPLSSATFLLSLFVWMSVGLPGIWIGVCLVCGIGIAIVLKKEYESRESRMNDLVYVGQDQPAIGRIRMKILALLALAQAISGAFMALAILVVLRII